MKAPVKVDLVSLSSGGKFVCLFVCAKTERVKGNPRFPSGQAPAMIYEHANRKFSDEAFSEDEDAYLDGDGQGSGRFGQHSD